MTISGLFVGVSPQQLDAIERRSITETRYSIAILAYYAEHGEDMPLEDAAQLYQRLQLGANQCAGREIYQLNDQPTF